MLFKPFANPINYDESADSGGGSPANQSAANNPAQSPEPQSYEDWYKGQPKEVQDLLTKNTTGLRNALQSERGQRADMEKKLRELAKTAEAGSQAQNDLTKMADDLQLSDRRASFYEQAHDAGVTNLKLAFMVAQSDDLFDKKGNIDFAVLRRDYPELFGRVKSNNRVKGDEGNGDGSSPQNQTGGGMNAFIRTAVGH